MTQDPRRAAGASEDAFDEIFRELRAKLREELGAVSGVDSSSTIQLESLERSLATSLERLSAMVARATMPAESGAPEPEEEPGGRARGLSTGDGPSRSSVGLQALDFGETSPPLSDGPVDSDETHASAGGADVSRAGPPPVPPTGTRYRERRELGRGGMGIVYEVWDENVQRPLAMKLLLTDAMRALPESARRDLVARFVKEAQITGQLDHPGVVPVHEIGEDESGRLFFTMRIVAGRSLEEILADRDREGDRWTTTRALGVLVKVCETLAYAHSKRVIHRDLKPANIMVGRFGETYVMDWGLAKILAEDDGGVGDESGDLLADLRVRSGGRYRDESGAHAPTLAGSILGTPLYMPPEQAQGRIGDLDERSDVYALGAILYELLAGRPPYSDLAEVRSALELVRVVCERPPTRVQALAPKTPVELEAICEKAMARVPDERYQAVEAMGDDLRAFLENRVVRAYRTGAVVELQKWVRRNPVVAALGALVLVALLVVIRLQMQRAHELVEHTQELEAEQRKTASALELEEIAHRRSQGLYLAGRSRLVVEDDPGLALALGLESHAQQPSAVANAAISSALERLQELATIDGLEDRFHAPVFSPDGTRVLAARADHVAYVADAATGDPISYLVGHSAAVRDAAFGPDGRTVVTASSDGTAMVWRAENGQRVTVLRPSGEARALSVAISPDGETVATGWSDGVARLWSIGSGELVLELEGHEARVRTVEFGPRGDRLLTGSADGSARLWSIDSGAPVAELSGHAGGLSVATYARSGRALLTVAAADLRRPGERERRSTERVARVWSPDGTLRSTLRGHDEVILHGAISDDAELVATASKDGSLRIWEASTGQQRAVIESGSVELSWVDIDPASRLVIAARDELQQGRRRATVWSLESFEPLFDLRGHDSLVRTTSFDVTGARALTGSLDGTVRTWRLDRAGELAPLQPRSHPYLTRLAPDGRRALLLTGSSSTVSVVRLADRESSELEHEDTVDRALFRAGSEDVVTRESSGRVLVWRGGGSPVSVEGLVRSDPFEQSDDGRFLLGLDLDGAAGRWSLETGSRAVRVALREGDQVRFSPDGLRLVVSSDTGSRLQDLESDRVVAALPGVSRTAMVFFSGDSRRFVTRDAQVGRVRHWDAATGRELTAPAPSLISTSLRPSLRGGRFTTVGLDGRARVHAEDGSVVAEVDHSEPALLALLGPDVARLVTLGQDRRARIWSLADGALIGEVGSDEAPVQDVRFGPRGQHLLVEFRGGVFGLVDPRHAGRILTTEHLEEPTASVRLGSDESFLVLTSVSGSVRVWPTDLAAYGARHRPRELSSAERDRHDIGTPRERLRLRQEARSRALRRDLELVIESLVDASDDEARVLPFLERLVGDQPASVRQLLVGPSSLRERIGALLSRLP